MTSQRETHSSVQSILLKGISQEVKSPSNLIANVAWAVDRRGALDEDTLDALKLAGRAAQSLIDAANDLELASGQVDTPADISLDGAIGLQMIVNQAMAELEPVAMVNGIALIGERIDLLPPLLVNPAAFANLSRRMLLCAMKLAEPGSQVRVAFGKRRASGRALELILDVRVTDPAHQSMDRHKTPIGHAMRLLAIDTLVRNLGGRLELRDETRDTRLLRLVFAALKSRLPDAPIHHEGLRLALVVDDHAGQRFVARRMLEQRSMAVAEAESGLEALEVMRLARFDMVLLDHHMPGMTGVELARRLRRELGFLGGLVLMTASEDPSLQEASLLAGIDVFLRKPLSAVNLAAALATVAEIHCDGADAETPDAAVA